MISQIQIKFSWQLVALLMAIEVLTIPFVALSNSFIINSKLNIVLMGFIVAFIALIIIIQVIKNKLKKYFSKKINMHIYKLQGAFYIGFLSGFLLMFMFYLQDFIASYTRNEYVISFVSTFISVGVSLLIYYVIQYLFNYGIKLVTEKVIFTVAIKLIDILILTILFSIYEIVAYKISGIWIPHQEHRFFWGLISGVGAGFFGSIPILIIARLSRYKFNLYLIDGKS